MLCSRIIVKSKNCITAIYIVYSIVRICKRLSTWLKCHVMLLEIHLCVLDITKLLLRSTTICVSRLLLWLKCNFIMIMRYLWSQINITKIICNIYLRTVVAYNIYQAYLVKKNLGHKNRFLYIKQRVSLKYCYATKKLFNTTTRSALFARANIVFSI